MRDERRRPGPPVPKMGPSVTAPRSPSTRERADLLRDDLKRMANDPTENRAPRAAAEKTVMHPTQRGVRIPASKADEMAKQGAFKGAAGKALQKNIEHVRPRAGSTNAPKVAAARERLGYGEMARMNDELQARIKRGHGSAVPEGQTGPRKTNSTLAREARADLQRAVKRAGTPAEKAGLAKAAKVPSAPAEGLAKTVSSGGGMSQAGRAARGFIGKAARIAGEAMRGLNVVETLPIPKEEFDRGMAKARSRYVRKTGNGPRPA